MSDLRATIETPVGWLTLTETDGAISRLKWGGSRHADDSPVLRQAVEEIGAYFEGTLTAFTVPLALGEDGFQRRFLQALIDIPFGETREYGDLAKDLSAPAQAIGQACGANRIPILIPCHRVLSASGLGGYSGAGGVETKVALLKHEGAASLLI
ncbi:MAG: methylated-DNA--[protein]-cysteine S-methyltransferase [Pseudomonadota bacterium]